MSAVVSGFLSLSQRLSSVCGNVERERERERGRHTRSAITLSVSLFVLWRRDVLPEGEEEGWTVAAERCEIQTLVNEQRSTAKSLG